VKRGHRVTVITAVPHYPTGQVLPEYKRRLISHSVGNEVKIIRVAVPSLNRLNLINRCFQFLCYQIGATLASINLKYDVALITNPALETLLPLTWQTIFRSKPVIFSVFDVYPDVGIKLGIFNNIVILKTITSLERFCLNQSAFVQIISESFKPSLRALGVPDAKMELVNIWVDTDLIKPSPQTNMFSKEHNLTDKFVVLYAGNIGLSQGLEHVLTTAEISAEQEDLSFVFVGDGSGFETLQHQARQRDLSNVLFIPFQRRERLPEVLASASASLVILRRGIGADSLPSKTFSILASGRPIIASVDENSETWKLVKRAEAGLCVSPENPHEMAKAINCLRQNKELREQFGKSGRLWVEKHHSPKFAAEQFEKLLLKTAHIKTT